MFYLLWHPLSQKGPYDAPEKCENLILKLKPKTHRCFCTLDVFLYLCFSIVGISSGSLSEPPFSLDSNRDQQLEDILSYMLRELHFLVHIRWGKNCNIVYVFDLPRGHDRAGCHHCLLFPLFSGSFSLSPPFLPLFSPAQQQLPMFAAVRRRIWIGLLAWLRSKLRLRLQQVLKLKMLTC